MQDVCYSTVVLHATSFGPDLMTYESMDLEASWYRGSQIGLGFKRRVLSQNARFATRFLFNGNKDRKADHIHKGRKSATQF
eukprot:scaffold762_cov363-Pavlova_lutheri.AAC.82